MTQVNQAAQLTIDPARLDRARAARLAEDERLVNMERARILMDGEREHASLERVPRQAAVLRDLCERITPVIRGDDVLVGRMPEVIPTHAEEALIEQRPELFVEPGVPGWLDSISICAPEWDLLLERGLGGIADEARGRLASSDDGRVEFYEAVISAMEAVSTLIRRYAGAARDLAAGSRPDRAAELQQIAERCERVAWEPPTDLPGALQLLQIVHMVLSCLVGGRDVTPGRMDQYLLRFYRASIETGQLTRDDAVTLLALFFLRLSQTAGNASDFESNHRRSPCRYTHLYVSVAGVDREGRPAENELSLVIADAIRRLAYKEPTLLLRYHAGIAPELLRRVTELMADRLAVTVYNDATVIPGLVENGVAEPEARNYAYSACHNAFVPGVEAGTGPGGLPQRAADAPARDERGARPGHRGDGWCADAGAGGDVDVRGAVGRVRAAGTVRS